MFVLFSPRKLGEDEPILTIIFFKWVGENHQLDQLSAKMVSLMAYYILLCYVPVQKAFFWYGLCMGYVNISMLFSGFREGAAMFNPLELLWRKQV